jgi:hypothetical protein
MTARIGTTGVKPTQNDTKHNIRNRAVPNPAGSIHITAVTDSEQMMETG